MNNIERYGLMGYKVFLESSIMQKGKPATAGSKMLAEFIAPVNATVVGLLEAAGVEIAGRVELGEFGASGLFAETGDDAASFLAENEALTETVSNADATLCNDYTGAISLAAASFGLYYIHPTYGTVSRYGLIPSVSSMDQIGVLCKNPEDGFAILKIISGYDKREKTNIKLKINHETQLNFKSEIYARIMQILCCAELANNISRYDGIKFGYRAKAYNGLNELYTKSRTEAFGEDVKLAAIIGAMVLYQEDGERIYDKAMKVRRVIRDSFEFDKYDLISVNNPAISRLCGFPSLTTPDCTCISAAGREDVLEAMLKDCGVQ